jgi:Tol biopolymer transport system component
MSSPLEGRWILGGSWLLSASLALLAGCSGGPAPLVPALGSSELPADLVYEREVAGNQDLYILPASGGPEYRLTTHPATDGLPRWSPDGRAVLFASDRDGHWQLYEVAAGGGTPRRVRTNAFRELQADTSPDGRRLAFVSNAGGHEALRTMDRVTGQETPLVRHGRKSVLGNPQWSPDGRRIVFSSNWRIGHHIYVVDVATGVERRVSGLTRGGCEPRFSRDGQRVVYVSRGHRGPTSRLLEHDLASGREKVLVDWPALNYSPVYSPDGSELAFSSNISGEWAVYRQRVADGALWRVTTGKSPARYPDSRPRMPH